MLLPFIMPVVSSWGGSSRFKILMKEELEAVIFSTLFYTAYIDPSYALRAQLSIVWGCMSPHPSTIMVIV